MDLRIGGRTTQQREDRLLVDHRSGGVRPHRVCGAPSGAVVASLHGYAGIDAEHGYARAHAHQPDVDAIARDCTGSVAFAHCRSRPSPRLSQAPTARLGSAVARRIRHGCARSIWSSRCKNAHRADLALQESVTSPVEAPQVAGPYKQSRAAENPPAFPEKLPESRCAVRPCRRCGPSPEGSFAPDQGESWMQERLRHISRDQRSKYVKAISAELADDVRRWQERQEQLVAALAAARDEDTRLLEELKNTLVHGVQVFETFETETPAPGLRGADCEL